MPTCVWSLILAAGRGRRLSGVTGGVPKQFWSPRGGPTLLDETVTRMTAIAPVSRTLTVIDQSQQHYLERLRHRPLMGRVLVQPLDRGTANGVLLGLSAIDREDAIVVITPSDHGITNWGIFHSGIRRAVCEVRAGQAHIVLFAVEPTSPAVDLGWIVPDSVHKQRASPFAPVGAFAEKPTAPLAERLFAAGAAWNTMIMVARVSRLLELYDARLPDAADVFAAARRLPLTRRTAFLEQQYRQLASADFSADLLASADKLHVHVWPKAIGWADLGTPERLRAWLSYPPQHGPAPRHAAPAPAAVLA